MIKVIANWEKGIDKGIDCSHPVIHAITEAEC